MPGTIDDPISRAWEEHEDAHGGGPSMDALSSSSASGPLLWLT